MAKKLSSVQANVIDALRKKNAVLVESIYYHWSKVWQGNKNLILSIHRPTVNFLKNKEFIIPVEGEKNKYILNPKWKFIKNKKQVA